MLKNTAEGLVKRSDHGAKGGSGVVSNNPDAKVDGIAVSYTDSLLRCKVRLEQRFIVVESLE